MLKEFIPYEQAIELKQLGFDEPCFYPFTNFSDLEWSKVDSCYADFKNWNDKRYGVVSAPLYQQAFRWFREKYDIHYSINRECSQHDHKWGYNWSLYNYTGIFDEFLTSHPDAPAGEWVYQIYEEAELACLKKLIEIIKIK